MANLNKFLWNILLFLFVVGIFYYGWQTWEFKDQVEQLRIKSESAVVGTDSLLLTTVTKLERNLKEQSNFEFTLKKNDPLDLTRVVENLKLFDNPQFFADKRERSPRLAATVLGDSPDNNRAIIRLRGKDWVVGPNEWFGDKQYKVLQIRQAEIIVSPRWGGNVVLPLEKAPENRVHAKRKSM